MKSIHNIRTCRGTCKGIIHIKNHNYFMTAHGQRKSYYCETCLVDRIGNDLKAIYKKNDYWPDDETVEQNAYMLLIAFTYHGHYIYKRNNPKSIY